MIFEKYVPGQEKNAAFAAISDMVGGITDGRSYASMMARRISGAVAHECHDTFYVAHEDGKAASRLWMGWGGIRMPLATGAISIPSRHTAAAASEADCSGCGMRIFSACKSRRFASYVPRAVRISLICTAALASVLQLLDGNTALFTAPTATAPLPSASSTRSIINPRTFSICAPLLSNIATKSTVCCALFTLTWGFPLALEPFPASRRGCYASHIARKCCFPRTAIASAGSWTTNGRCIPCMSIVKSYKVGNILV